MAQIGGWCRLACAASSRQPRDFDPIRCDQRIFVFPHVNRKPVQLLELGVLATIPFLIRSKLFAPPLGVVLRENAVVSASVPEASIDEHGDSCASESHVGRAGEPTEPDAVTEPSTVELSSESQLGSSIPARHASELAAYRIGQGLGAASHVPSVPVGNVR